MHPAIRIGDVTSGPDLKPPDEKRLRAHVVFVKPRRASFLSHLKQMRRHPGLGSKRARQELCLAGTTSSQTGIHLALAQGPLAAILNPTSSRGSLPNPALATDDKAPCLEGTILAPVF